MGTNSRILVVDDNDANRLALACVLSEEAYEVTKAEGFDTMMESLRTSRPDLILLDYVLPGKNGIEICTILKNDRELSRISLAIVSICDDRNIERQGLEAGAEFWRIKPLDIELLLESIRTVLGKTNDRADSTEPNTKRNYHGKSPGC